MKKTMQSLCMLLFATLFLLTISTTAKASVLSGSKANYNYASLQKDTVTLQQKYPSIITYQVIGKSADNRNLYELTIGNPNAKKHLLVISNLHAREHMNIRLCMAQIERYCENYNKKINGTKVSSTLNQVAIHYIPSANPDGTAISQYGFQSIRNTNLRKALRKMRGSSRTWKANARGVDLNRNWDIAWKAAGTKGSSGYRGSKAGSEPETMALVQWINSIQERGAVVGVVSYHSTGSILYGRCASQASSTVKSATTKMYKLAQKLTGYRLMPTESIIQARGCSREYFLYKRSIPCITLETGRSSCPLGSGEYNSIWNKNKDLVIREAQLFD